jgi:hypothetical protein
MCSLLCTIALRAFNELLECASEAHSVSLCEVEEDEKENAEFLLDSIFSASRLQPFAFQNRLCKLPDMSRKVEHFVGSRPRLRIVSRELLDYRARTLEKNIEIGWGWHMGNKLAL